MNGDRIRVFRWLSMFLTALATSGTIVSPSALDTNLQNSLEIVEREHAGLCPTAQVSFETTVGQIGDEIRAELTADPSRSVEALNRRLFSGLGLRGSTDLKDPCNLLPSGVLQGRQGYCVGIAAIYLAVAERLRLPIHAVATPSHVFLRYDDGKKRVNVETLQVGANIPDEQYIREQKIPEVSIRRGVFMRNLSTEEFLAQFHNNLGVIYSEKKDFARAAQEYESALRLDRRLAAAMYNYAVDLLRTGETRRAVRLFSKSLRLYPTDVWALNNRGLAFMKMGRIQKARRDFEEALKIDPTFAQAKENLDRLMSREF